MKPAAPPHILLAGNHTCGNRGDAAILRGLIDCLEEAAPDLRLTATSRFPVSSSYLLGRPLAPDLLHDWPGEAAIRPYRLKKWWVGRTPRMLAAAVERGGPLPRAIPRAVRDRIGQLGQYDAVIQVGGSFFVDVYGDRQFETPLCALLANRPLFLAGHSLGPFTTPSSHALARTLLSRADEVILRETASLDLLREAGLPLGRAQVAGDTAWLVRPGPDGRQIHRSVMERTGGRPAVAVTLRDLAPFDKRLGVSQEEFESAFAALCTAFIGGGYDVIAVSMCTGIEGYRDDRIPALRVAEKVNRPGRFHVIVDELNDLEIGHLLSACSLLVGTRLHSAIIAMNFGTPAIALNYEHKSRGIMRELGLPEAALDLPALLDGSLRPMAMRLAADSGQARARLRPRVERERAKARSGVHAILRHLGIGERKPARKAEPVEPEKSRSLVG